MQTFYSENFTVHFACGRQLRVEFAVWAELEEAIPHNVWFSDVICLHMHGIVSK
jgi:hypothetical protein